ncbi:MAG: hypothetical protein A3F15_01235 [Candidatus Wildermuthbacteria bacterium RIFCSPHIGHO2_12_FULL_40_12]|uniref:bAvd-like domain-containing protein n=1 Tax=Candidatus Wildermuthbacteria bacterium RIFCSPHIGHO2_12_FULL_40_12 TaxID=1802457 RepID=A0A1G2RFH4_9BACT|nr:MAG: hypothetical protein A3F15_01235 [Candidatus Wildermuthbacteria bacterium RIFCSPHIGHO2_12_FULL_40_12]
MKNFLSTPPPEGFEAPLIHVFCDFYKKIYFISQKIPKRDRFGIFAKIENICLEIINLIIAASLEIKINKFPILTSARIKIETLKRLIRITYELNVIERKKYLNLESDLQEISKMTNGWIKYLK